MQVSENRWHLPTEVGKIVRRLMEESASLSPEERQSLELLLATGQLDFARPVKRTINNIEGTYETRVFIGGSYKPHLAILIEIRDFLRQDGRLIPILASDYEMPREETHRHSLILLHNCRHAIFEVSSGSGQLMELERSRDYETEVLVVFNTVDPVADPSHVTSMVKSYGATCKGYRMLAELRQIVEDQVDRWMSFQGMVGDRETAKTHMTPSGTIKEETHHETIPQTRRYRR
jgi:hypothetical protein